MTISAGEKLPEATFYVKEGAALNPLTTADVFSGKKVVVFGLPGAFTSTCSEKHLPGYVVNVDKIKAKGVDTVACLSVNDAHVMAAWSDAQNAEHILMLSDGMAEFTKAIGMELDLSVVGMGIRSNRYAMIVDDGVVTHIASEKPKEYEVSSAEAILEKL